MIRGYKADYSPSLFGIDYKGGIYYLVGKQRVYVDTLKLQG
jgi:hypothetical protein